MKFMEYATGTAVGLLGNTATQYYGKIACYSCRQMRSPEAWGKVRLAGVSHPTGCYGIEGVSSRGWCCEVAGDI